MYPGLGDAFGDAKAKWEGVAGILYTGNASGADQMLAAYQQLVRIANGDPIAMLDAYKGSDPQMRQIARDYLGRLAQSSEGNFLQLVRNGTISPALFQELTTRALNNEPWWRYERENRIGQAIFPYLGAGSGSSGGYARNLAVGFEYRAQNIYDYDFDFAALTNAARAWAQAHPLDEAPSPEAIEQVNKNVPSAPNPDTPPPGWRATTYQGQAGFFGPDGLFYRGARPWLGGGSGVSVTTPTPPSNTPPKPATTPPPGSPGPTPPNPTAPAPMPANPDGSQSAPPPDPFSGGLPDEPPTTAGFSGGTALIAIAAVVGAILFSRKR